MELALLLLPEFALILCGYLICRFSALDRSVWQSVDKLVYYFLFPTLLFYSIIKTPLDLGAASSLIGAGLSLAAAGIALAYSLPRWPWLGKHLGQRDHAASAQIGFRFNSFIVLALLDRLAGAQGVLLMSVLIGFCVPVFNVAAVWPMARHSSQGLLRELLRNPLIIATLSALLLNVLGFRLPEFMHPTVQRIGAASLALGLMAAGAGMQLGSLKGNAGLATAVLTIKHLMLPLLAWLLAAAWSLDPLQRQVLLAFSAVPTASSSYVLAARMGYNGALVAALVTMSTLLGMLSLPLALGVLAALPVPF